MKAMDDLAQGDIEGATNLMAMLASKSRLQILCRLSGGEKSVGWLAEACDLPQPRMSQQLKVLKQARLVQTRREGQTIYYSLKGAEVTAMLNTLHELYCDGPAHLPS